MAPSDSPPRSNTSDKIKISVPTPNPKTFLALLAMLVGGGGVSFGAVHLATVDDVAGAIEEHSEETASDIEAVIESDKRQDAEIIENHDQISKVHIVLGQVQTVQRTQFARDEAARVTEEIQNKERRRKEYDRLVDRNMWRLERGEPPCSTVTCAD